MLQGYAVHTFGSNIASELWIAKNHTAIHVAGGIIPVLKDQIVPHLRHCESIEKVNLSVFQMTWKSISRTSRPGDVRIAPC